MDFDDEFPEFEVSFYWNFTRFFVCGPLCLVKDAQGNVLSAASENVEFYLADRVVDIFSRCR